MVYISVVAAFVDPDKKPDEKHFMVPASRGAPSTRRSRVFPTIFTINIDPRSLLRGGGGDVLCAWPVEAQGLLYAPAT